VIVAILIALAIAFSVLMLGFKWQRHVQINRDQQNIQIQRQEFIDLKEQLESGDLTQEQYQQAYDELVIALGNDLHNDAPAPAPRWMMGQGLTLGVVFVFLAAVSFGLYYKLGSPQALNPGKQEVAMEQAHTQAGMSTMPSVADMVEGLRQKLEKDPDNFKGWMMLGRSYMVLKHYDKAVAAIEHAYTMKQDDPNVQLFYADALTMQNGGLINDKAFSLIKRALEKAPENPTAIWMAAMGYESEKDYKTAVSYWQKLLPKVKASASDYQEVEMHLAHAQARLSGKPMVIPSPGPALQFSNAQGGASVTAVIKLADKYKQQVKPTDTLFVFARAVNGPRQPLAAKRLQVKDLPATITLDDSMAMSPMNKLSDYKQVYIGARISKSGNVMPSSGDLEGRSASVATKPSGQNIEVTIDQEVM